ncbi:acetyltransferase [Erwinia phage vB_EamM_Caitlin]|uniref:acetyltransferase n=1 Tax=Erwinia phage vB_EamM_Caitlin TaxID=1883379 RepID=UPI00081CB722|nr:acetyltransferase [Erwinia phage vB_EamM_Caitlin]ANZ48496.1 hypothetical protein CAITLIN_201 [Erwinia phage vB_EamM_Caitlin]
MTEIVILDNASQLTSEQQKQLLNLHYSFLNYQRAVLEANHPIPELRVSQLFAGNRIGIAMRNGQPVGYCVYRIVAGVLKIRTLFVLESYRRDGLMTELLNTIRKNATFWQATLTIHKNCKAAVSFFQNRGYQSHQDGEWMQMALYITESAADTPIAATA